MTPTDPLLRLRADIDRMDRDLGSLESRLERFGRTILIVRASIEVRYRQEHYGRDPVRPFAWTVPPVPAVPEPLPRSVRRPAPRPSRAPAVA